MVFMRLQHGSNTAPTRFEPGSNAVRTRPEHDRLIHRSHMARIRPVHSSHTARAQLAHDSRTARTRLYTTGSINSGPSFLGFPTAFPTGWAAIRSGGIRDKHGLDLFNLSCLVEPGAHASLGRIAGIRLWIPAISSFVSLVTMQALIMTSPFSPCQSSNKLTNAKSSPSMGWILNGCFSLGDQPEGFRQALGAKGEGVAAAHRMDDARNPHSWFRTALPTCRIRGATWAFSSVTYRVQDWASKFEAPSIC